MFWDFLNDIGNYDDRKISRLDRDDSPSGVGVSTAFTSDEGYETALLSYKVIAVERYRTRTQAVKGHKRWVKFAKNAKSGDVVRELLWGDKFEDNVSVL